MPWRWRRLRRRPAVSTSTNVRSPRSSTVSIASRVVPGISETIEPLLAEQLVHEARLADVRPAEDRDADRALRQLRALLASVRVEVVDDLVEQVAGAVAVQAGDRDRVAEAELVQLERERLLLRVVDLVRDHEHRLLRLAQDLRDLLVTGRDPDLRVEHEEDDVGLRDRLARLVGDRARDRRRVGDVDAAGVDEEEAPVPPLAEELLAVARDARRLVHDGGPRAGQAVDEGRLPDVREADDRDGADGLHGPMVLEMGSGPAFPAFELREQRCFRLRRHVALPEGAREPDRLPELLDVLRAVRAAGEMPVEACAVAAREVAARGSRSRARRGPGT